jgi:periplasmic protein TonB
VASTSASRTPEAAARGAASPQPSSQPAADVTAITTRDDFLLELGQTLGGQAAVRPVDTVDAAVTSMTSSKRAQVLVIDAHDVPGVREAVDAVRTAVPRAVVIVFAASGGEKQLSTALKGTKVFAVLPTPIDPRKTQAVIEGAIAEAVENKDVRASAPAQPEFTLGPLRPEEALPLAPADTAGDGGSKSRLPLVIAGVAALALAAAGAWFFTQNRATTPASSAPAVPAAATSPAAAPGTPPETVPTPAADTTIVKGKVDELLEKARLAMHERRFTEPAGDNALLYYRSAVAANADSAEARDGLQRVAGVLAGRFEEAMTAARFDEAALTLANFKAAAPQDERVAAFEQRLYSAEVNKALSDGNLDRAAAYLKQAQQSSVPAEQINRWRSDISRRQEDAKVQRLAGLVEDRIRDGHLLEADDSAKSYMQQLQSAAPANATTQRVAHELESADLRKAREAALAKNSAEEDRWLNEARAMGAKPADIAAFERDLAGARQKAAQAETERTLGLVRDRLRDGRLSDPAQDSAAYYLTQLQTSDPSNPGVTAASSDLAGKLLDRARTATLAGKPADADLALARRFGADPKDIAGVQQLQPQAKPAATAVDPATLAANLKRLRGEPPEYPQSALLQHVSGTVTVAFTVDVHGATRDVHVTEASPPGVFDQAATAAVKRWRYAPMVVNGAAVEVPTSYRMRFELPKDR